MTASLPRCAPQRRFTVDDLLSLDDFQRYHGATCALSPDGGSVCFAVIRPLADACRFDRPYLGGLDRAELYLFQFADRTLRRLAGDVRAGHAFGSPTWSPDGRWIAAIALSADDDCVHAVLIDPSTAAVTPIPAPRSVDLASPDRDGPLKWLADGRVALPLLAEGRTPIAMHLPRRLFANAHDAWQACSLGRQPTADVLDSDAFGTAPVAPAPDWWAFAPGSRTLDPLTHDECVRAGLSPASPVPATPAVDVDAATPRAREGIRRERVSTGADDRYAAFVEHARDATRLTIRRTGSSAPDIVFETNRHLARIAAGTPRRLPCRGAEPGRPRYVDLLLPPDYAGAPMPAIVWVYPHDRAAHRDPHMFHEPDCPLPFNFHPLAAHGFVVVDVDLRSVAGVEPASMASRMLDDVCAAVDAAAEAGYVDRDRLHLYGQSLGGWATMMLLAHTSMFRSGISSAGISDAAALHASLDPRLRYETGHDARAERFELLGKLLADTSWSLDADPCADPHAYHAISPIRHAARITTPLLLIHGDADYVPLEQSERMFATLAQLGRDVRLIRYWGDDHVPQSPANIADRYRRIVDWLQRN
ncbi:S9 family peptidase [Burkholderia multivorans]|uniref:Peptidase S9 prolyl oligopeptidase catalytic domain-containing protein n=1 Tax=Burkholderia multivorans TaxID=87883 RepID=A0A2S9MQW5_9BURK|nr:prolyl oligopeptidase family serine peptidase [Burkholderia multivorans]MBU9144075.1 prolyl oligopeptidase family serine peptidase [Burkholderia multivorans]MBU9513791.1 prolyl oligopeptidase family serine peptidase [Burkholderia multivorans]MBU9523787.1 prolyl oligopeptidase family serine peptidase [Burkholderia multivorans]MBU9537799.1 prolyl oligopeptidase family serine peptidase [Burkholderia multivorans]MBU9637305.1 prolyl oligopeptidase family serine peptidase [Burkholderia multivoran